MSQITNVVAEPQHEGHLASAEEHGGEWVTCKRCGRQWAIHGAEAEIVTEGDGFCEDAAAQAEARELGFAKLGWQVRVRDSHGIERFRGDLGTIEKYVPFGKYYVWLESNGRQLVAESDLDIETPGTP